MKTIKYAVSVMVAILATSVIAAGQSKKLIPSVPAGDMVTTPTVVRTGTYPTLSWRISYPSNVGSFATINKGVVTLTKQSYVSVRAIGVGVTGGNANAATSNVDIRMNTGSGFQQLFYGTNADVDPAHVLYTKSLNVGASVNFGGRFEVDNTLSPFYTGNSSNLRVVVLVDGDKIPTTYDLKTSGKLASYLAPYVDGTSKISVGPTSAIVLMEVGASKTTDGEFDYQDIALLVTISDKNNNGHGNNLDGVDSSNPGKGSGGPSGAEDPSGGVDDESK
jgi:hypothetical protein